MRVLLVLLILPLCGTLAERDDDVTSYKDYKVWMVTPQSPDDVHALHHFGAEDHLDFWESPRVGRESRVMVHSRLDGLFINFLRGRRIPHHVLITDLDGIFQRERDEIAAQEARLILEKAQAKKSNTKADVRFDHFWSPTEINDYMLELANEYFYFVERFPVAVSTEGRQIYGLKMSLTGRVTGARPIIFIDATVHAREWIAPMQAIFLMNQLVTNWAENLETLECVDVIFVPLVNIDGYEHSRVRNRLWRKTRSINNGSTCVGTDGNRNYEFQWNPGPNACSETFGGPEPFSEPEIAGLRDILQEFRLSIKTSISLHSYGNLFLWPWGYAPIRISNWEQHQEMGDLFADAIRNATGTNYTVGNTAEVLYTSYGASKDYAASIGIPLAYTLELTAGGSTGFDLPPDQILPVVEETYIGFRQIGRYIAEYYNRECVDAPSIDSRIWALKNRVNDGKL